MTYKSIEVYYDIKNILGIRDRSAFSGEALKFRAVIRQAVAGTEYEGIREIDRHEMSEEDLEETPQVAADFKMPIRLKVFMILAAPLALLFLLVSLIKLPFRALMRR